MQEKLEKGIVILLFQFSIWIHKNEIATKGTVIIELKLNSSKEQIIVTKISCHRVVKCLQKILLDLNRYFSSKFSFSSKSPFKKG